MMQLLLTFVVAAPFQTVSAQWLNEHLWLIYSCAVLSLVLVCAISCCQKLSRSFPTNYLLLFSFTACEGVLVGFISAQYTVKSVLACVGITVLIFGGLTVYAWTTKKDFTGCGPYLFGALISLIMFSICMGLLRFVFGFDYEYVEMGYDIL